MKKSLKKVLAVILSAVMIVSCSATSVFAQDPISTLKMIKDVVDYGESVVTLGEQTVDTVTGLPGRVLNLGISYINLQKANGDLVTAVLKDGVTTITLPVNLAVSLIKQGVAVVSNGVETGSSSVKFVIALVQYPPAVLGDFVSVGKLGSAVTSGLVTNAVNDVKLIVGGVETASAAADLINPSLSELYNYIIFPFRAGTAIGNIIDIAKGDDDENAKELVGTAVITDHGETAVEETELTADEEEAPVETAAVEAVVANTDGPMD